MAKKVKATVRLYIQAGKANPGQKIGPALAQHGINLMAFCKEYNARTASMAGQIVPAELTIYADSSFTFVLRTPPTADMLRRAAGIEKGSGVPNKNKVGKITRKQLREIAEAKLKDLNTGDMDMAMRQIAGTARNMGIEVSD
jgi:large subunit ribosomal protein L11